MAEKAESPSLSRIGILIPLIVLAAAVLIIVVKYRSNQAVLVDMKNQLGVVQEKVKGIRDDHERLVREGAQARIERDEERERSRELEGRLEEVAAALEGARAELTRARRERDDHLAARLDLEARLEAAMSELAK